MKQTKDKNSLFVLFHSPAPPGPHTKPTVDLLLFVLLAANRCILLFMSSSSSQSTSSIASTPPSTVQQPPSSQLQSSAKLSKPRSKRAKAHAFAQRATTTLVYLLQALSGKRLRIELRNETQVLGLVQSVDDNMTYVRAL